MSREKCIFCPNPLDGSDEHILPQSINGRLHSKEIICHDCNVRFGAKVDPVFAETFFQFIHLLGLKNAKTIYVEDPQGKKYTKDKDHKVKPVKPEMTIQRKNGLIYVHIEGDEKNALKLLEKQKKKLQPAGGDPIKLEIKRETLSNPPLGFDIKLEVDYNLVLAVNKISLEFYAYNNFDLSFVTELLEKVGNLDLSLNNVTVCNLKQEVRLFEDYEISHFIALKGNKEEKVLYAYLELFNIFCCVIVLKEDYRGPVIDIQYRQDVITGKQLGNYVTTSVDVKNLLNNFLKVKRDDFGILIDLFCERHHDKTFKAVLDDGLQRIQTKLKQEITDGRLKQEEYIEKYIQLSAEFVAHLTVFDFPYIVADLDENQEEMVNYIHSSMKEKFFDEFVALNKKLIGFGIAFTSEGHSPEKCIIESFLKTPVAKRNDEQIVKVYCVLRNEETGDLKYIPFKDLFEALRRRQEENKT